MEVKKFNNFKKYNGNILVDNIMFYLRNFEDNEHKVKMDEFLKKTNIDKDVFLTFLNEKDVTNKVNFDIFLEGDYVIFKGFKDKNFDDRYEHVKNFENFIF